MPFHESDYTWREELYALTREILDRLEVPYTRRYLTRVVDLEDEYTFGAKDRPPASEASPWERETDNPDLQIEAITDTLAAFDVWTALYDAGDQGISTDDPPALLLLDRDNEAGMPGWTLLRGVDSGRWDTVDAAGRAALQSFEEIQSRWTGVIATFRRSEDSGQSDLGRHRAADGLWWVWRWLGSVLAVGIAVVAGHGLLLAGGPALVLAWCAVKVAGLAVSRKLKQIETTGEYRSRALERFCRLREGFNCQRLLSLPGAKLLGVVGWSDVGIAYFATTLALLLLAGLVPADSAGLLGLAALLAAAALPYTIYSVVYQRFVARTGCMLCLTVQALLWAEFGLVVLLRRAGALALPSLEAAALAGAAALFTVLWLIERSRGLDAAMDARRFQVRHLALARDPTVFLARLASGPTVDTTVLPGEIAFGCGDEEVQILAVLDPGCRFCAAAYRHLQQLRERLEDGFGLRVRLVTERSGLGTWHDLLPLTLAGRTDEAKSLLDRWYLRVIELRRRGWVEENGRLDPAHYERWKAEVDFPRVAEPPEMEDVFRRYTGWEEVHVLEKWPELFVNGHYWPASHPYDPYLPRFFEHIEEWVRGEDRA